MSTGDHLPHVSSGDPFPRSAPTVNAWMDAARAHQLGRLRHGRQPRVWTPPQANIVNVRNDSGSARARFDVMGIDSIVFEPATKLLQFQNDAVFSCVTPTSEHEGKFVILLEPLPVDASGNGEIGKAVASGVSVVQIDVNDVDHEYAEASAGIHRLESRASGSAQILWKDAGTGAQWARVRFPDAAAMSTYGGLYYGLLPLSLPGYINWGNWAPYNGVTLVTGADGKIVIETAGYYAVHVHVGIEPIANLAVTVTGNIELHVNGTTFRGTHRPQFNLGNESPNRPVSYPSLLAFDYFYVDDELQVYVNCSESPSNFAIPYHSSDFHVLKL